MFISPSNRFAFLHSRKTAGSSITIQLAKNMADDDIMIGSWPEAVRQGLHYNKNSISAAKSGTLKYLRKSIRNFIAGQGFGPTPNQMNRYIKRYYHAKHGLDAGPHSSAATVKNMMGDDWDRTFKFAFVRNPWDHAVSDYYWRQRARKAVTFKEFLYLLRDPTAPDPHKARPPIITNWSVYAIDDQIVTDFVGRFEKLTEDLEKVSKEIGVNFAAGLPRAKSTQREKSKPLAEHYDDEDIEMVRDIYRKEIEAFKYTVPF